MCPSDQIEEWEQEEDDSTEEPLDTEILIGQWEGGDDEVEVTLDILSGDDGDLVATWMQQDDEPVELEIDLDE